MTQTTGSKAPSPSLPKWIEWWKANLLRINEPIQKFFLPLPVFLPPIYLYIWMPMVSRLSYGHIIDQASVTAENRDRDLVYEIMFTSDKRQHLHG